MTTLEKIKAEIEQIADEEHKHDEKWAIGLRYAVKIIDKYAEQEPTIGQLFSCEEVEELRNKIWKQVEQEPCDDVVSRQAITKLKRHNLVEGQFVSLYDIEKLPSVRPQEQTGHWIKSKDGYMRCDQCGSRGSAIKARFCHHCGARMVEPQESEEISERNMKMWQDIFEEEKRRSE